MKQEITLLGRPASKKNSRLIFYKNNRYFNIPQKAATAFEADALKQLLQYKRMRLTGKLFVTYTFYQKGKLEQDGDNGQATINDVLQKGGIIANDRDIKKWSGEIINGAKDWKTIITIELL